MKGKELLFELGCYGIFSLFTINTLFILMYCVLNNHVFQAKLIVILTIFSIYALTRGESNE